MISAYKRQFADRTLPELGVLLQRVKDRIAETEAELKSDRADMDLYEGPAKRWLVQLAAKKAAISVLIDNDERGLRKAEVLTLDFAPYDSGECLFQVFGRRDNYGRHSLRE